MATVAEPVTRVKDASSVANAMPGLRVRRHRRGRGQVMAGDTAIAHELYLEEPAEEGLSELRGPLFPKIL